MSGNKYLLEILQIRSEQEVSQFTGVSIDEIKNYLNSDEEPPYHLRLLFYLYYECIMEGINLNEDWDKKQVRIGSHWFD